MSEYSLLLLRRASRACYLFGAWMVFTLLLLVGYELSSILSPSLGITSESLQQTLESLRLLYLVLGSVSLSLSVLFAFYMSKVGGIYSLRVLKVLAVACLTLQGISLLTETPVLSAGSIMFLLSPPAVDSGLAPLILTVAYLVSIVFIVSLAMGASSMHEKTRVEAFRSAMIFGIIGIFIPIVVNVAVILLGSALSTTASLIERRVCPKCGREVPATADFCKYCGAETKATQQT